MDGQEIRQLAGVALAGVLIRLIVFRDVAVNGDTGLYLYDAKQILWGHQMLVDFPSRSPLFEWLLAGVIQLGDSPLVAARGMMVVVGLLLGIAVYVLGRRLHSHRAGLVAAILFYLTPFQIVWGLWVKTEQAAQLVALAAVILAVPHLDADRIPRHIAAAIGVLFGVAFLVRRVAIIHVGAFGLFVLYYRYMQLDDVRETVRAGTVIAAGAGVTLLATYAIMARGDIATTLAVAHEHLVALFTSRGHGSVDWIATDRASPVTAEDRGTILAMICQKCGLNTIQIFTRTILVIAPVLVLLVAFLRSYAREGSRWLADVLMPITLGLAGLTQITLLLSGRYVGRAFALVAFIGAVIVVWRLDPIDWDDLWSPKLGLVMAVLLGLTAGYLYRDRILYVTYFQDFYPWLVILAGVTLVELHRANDIRTRKWLAVGGAAVLTLSMVAAAGAAYPYEPGGVPEESHWFSVDNVQEYGADIEQRTAPDETVLTAQPLYAVEADRKIAGNLSRKYYIFHGWPNSTARGTAQRQLLRDMDSGRAAVVIIDHEYQVIARFDALNETVRTHYCYQPSDLYAETGAELHVRRTDYTGGDCVARVG